MPGSTTGECVESGGAGQAVFSQSTEATHLSLPIGTSKEFRTKEFNAIVMSFVRMGDASLRLALTQQ